MKNMQRPFDFDGVYPPDKTPGLRNAVAKIANPDRLAVRRPAWKHGVAADGSFAYYQNLELAISALRDKGEKFVDTNWTAAALSHAKLLADTTAVAADTDILTAGYEGTYAWELRWRMDTDTLVQHAIPVLLIFTWDVFGPRFTGRIFSPV